jgi:hypothetical protein
MSSIKSGKLTGTFPWTYRDFPQELFSSLMLLPKSNACFRFSCSDKVYGRESGKERPAIGAD